MRINVDRFYASEESIWGEHMAIWEVSLQDFDLTTLHNDLYTMTWKGNQPQGPLRFVPEQSLPESLSSFKKKVESLKNDLLEQMYETGSDYIKQHWYCGLDFYKENSRIFSEFNKDLPGFFMEPHVDNGHIMFQLLLNLTENDSGTAFHNPSTNLTATSISEPVYRASGEQGKGIIFLNNTNSAHSINHINRDRYILYTSIYS